MSVLRITLLCDGSYDRSLVYPIRWLLHQKGCHINEENVADLSRVKPRPRSLREKADASVALYPCDILFVHRDSERLDYADRLAEIDRELVGAQYCFVPVVPVRMTEAWFLHSEQAIREACGNPNGTVALNLPSADSVSRVPNPKQLLEQTLISATESSGRRRKKAAQAVSRMKVLVPQYVSEYVDLLPNESFRRLVDAVDSVLPVLCPRV